MPEEVRQKWWTPYPPHTGHVRNVFIHPDDPRILYVCLEHGGVVRSFDRGATWEDVSDGIDYVDMHLLANLPGSKERYYVTSARGFFTREDPARGWERAEEGMTRNYFHDFLFLPPAQAGAAPQMLISAGDGSPGVWRRESQSARAAVFRSDDCGESWYRVGHNLPEDMPAFMWALTPHPTDPGAVFGGVGAVNRGQAEDTPSNGSVALDDAPGDLLLSRDRGDTWERLPLTLGALARLGELGVEPLDDRVLLVAAAADAPLAAADVDAEGLELLGRGVEQRGALGGVEVIVREHGFLAAGEPGAKCRVGAGALDHLHDRLHRHDALPPAAATQCCPACRGRSSQRPSTGLTRARLYIPSDSEANTLLPVTSWSRTPA
jgi:hypothetical protein